MKPGDCVIDKYSGRRGVLEVASRALPFRRPKAGGLMVRLRLRDGSLGRRVAHLNECWVKEDPI